MSTAINLDLVVVPFSLALARVGALMASCPMFVAPSVATQVRAGVAALLAGAMAFSVQPLPSPPDHLIVAVVGELFLGAIMGSSVRLVAVGISFAGEQMDGNIGFLFSRQVNPLTSEETTPLMHMSQLLAAALFFVADGQSHVIRALWRSFVLFPMGSVRFDAQWITLVSSKFGGLIEVGLILSMPIVLALTLVHVAFAFLSKVAPQLNMWGVGFLGTCGVGLLALWIYTPAWLLAMAQLWQDPKIYVMEG